MQKASRPVL